MTLRNKNIGRQIIEIGSICLAAAGILATAPQSASTQTRENCDRIYNGDISKLSVTKRLSYESNRRECYNGAQKRIAYSIREQNLRAAMLKVENDYLTQNGTFIQINKNNVTQMMQNIGATPSERQFVRQQMSRYIQ